MIPEVPELPEIRMQQMAAQVIRRPAVDPLPNLRTESILGYDPRAVAAAEYAHAVAVAYAASRVQDAIMRSRSREEERAIERSLGI